MMKVIWSKSAVDSMRQIEDYILKEFGEKARKNFIQEVEHVADILAEMPELGRPERLLAHRNMTYRSIVIRKLSKMVYYIKDDTIRISALWDVRREPKSQINHLR
ncbi:MAG: type II toxin-antitoxin system RelE/ParE family toxin [Prevotella sp.]|uniref:type II toxin-antitoxin system RelE/ParE family toxin n=1 Tax=Prevotella sp. TaxID=59823 RepID=UPI002A256046|nr:type II toxin-antitoxin system RelE/ParE family toxin [Prevotella sp.]MDD7317731.1 type II toxin-antitoxin system RelE/ParE family toxin [Prevotellaceae bacterium]MDY4020646.1 type II toxin-antitoxin system RelE/ParE family toxin [Prevotella sp.]